jgi:hypothetical protein
MIIGVIFIRANIIDDYLCEYAGPNWTIFGPLPVSPSFPYALI